MERRVAIAFTAVYLKAAHGYVAFVEELPGFTSHGQTLGEARANLARLVEVVLDEERARAEELLEGKDAVREPLRAIVPRA